MPTGIALTTKGMIKALRQKRREFMRTLERTRFLQKRWEVTGRVQMIDLMIEMLERRLK